MTNTANITPEVIKWARTTAHISVEAAAGKVPTTTKKLLEWESGISKPTINQAKKLAKIYKRPFVLLFLREIPLDFQPLQDFRNKGSKPLSTASIFIIREIQQKQAWISELNQENNFEKLNFIGKYSISNNPKEVANDIIKELNINPLNYKTKNPNKVWIESAERKGIFISRSSYINSKMTLDSEEFQGFVIADSYAPFIFINTDDWGPSQLFTLIHELAHLWLAESGISNITEVENNTFNNHPVELFCNEVAANILMPENSFKENFNERNLQKTANIYNVSSYAVIVRALNLNIITYKQYQILKNNIQIEYNDFLKREVDKKEELKKKGGKGGPDYFLLQINKNSRLFTQVVLDAYKGGMIEPTLASSLLNVKIDKFSRLEAILY